MQTDRYVYNYLLGPERDIVSKYIGNEDNICQALAYMKVFTCHKEEVDSKRITVVPTGLMPDSVTHDRTAAMKVIMYTSPYVLCIERRRNI